MLLFFQMKTQFTNVQFAQNRASSGENLGNICKSSLKFLKQAKLMYSSYQISLTLLQIILALLKTSITGKPFVYEVLEEGILKMYLSGEFLKRIAYPSPDLEDSTYK